MDIKLGLHLLNLTESSRQAIEQQGVAKQFAQACEQKQIAFVHSVHEKSSMIDDWTGSIEESMDTMVVLGIGGSSLGAQALYAALGQKYPSRRLLFVDNIDPVSLTTILNQIDMNKTLWNIVSKSGNTLETLAQTMIVIDAIVNQLGKDKVASHVVMTTSAGGTLMNIAQQWAIPVLSVSPSIVGRFSVLSPLGLVPAAFVGIDINRLYEGARSVLDESVGVDDMTVNHALNMAGTLYAFDKEHGRSILVMMPYADRLIPFGHWFCQLWAESLGKQDKQHHHVGTTPVVARGVTDQHSQVQLYLEGPKDKIVFILDVENQIDDMMIPSISMDNDERLAMLEGLSLGTLMTIEMHSVMKAFETHDCPYGRLTLTDVNEYSLGQLLMFWQVVTALSGALYGVETYKQPSVENMKMIIHQNLQQR